LIANDCADPASAACFIKGQAPPKVSRACPPRAVAQLRRFNLARMADPRFDIWNALHDAEINVLDDEEPNT